MRCSPEATAFEKRVAARAEEITNELKVWWRGHVCMEACLRQLC
jgi:hypothetical protein